MQRAVTDKKALACVFGSSADRYISIFEEIRVNATAKAQQWPE